MKKKTQATMMIIHIAMKIVGRTLSAGCSTKSEEGYSMQQRKEDGFNQIEKISGKGEKYIALLSRQIKKKVKSLLAGYYLQPEIFNRRARANHPRVAPASWPPLKRLAD
jgi:hypothetical protein